MMTQPDSSPTHSADCFYSSSPAELPKLRRLMDASLEIAVGPLQCIRPLHALFADFVASEEMSRLLSTELSAMDEDSSHVPGSFSAGTMVLAESRAVVVTATLLDARHAASRSIFSPVADAIYGIPGSVPFDIAVHKRPPGACHDVFDESQGLELRPGSRIEPRGTLFITAAEDVPEYRTQQRCLVVKLTSRCGPPLVWVYDKSSGRPVMASSGSLSASRTQMMLKTMVALLRDRPDHALTADALDAMEGLARHDLHFVRWTAIQSLCAIDFARGLELLRAGAHDAHPHVANASRKALARFDSQASTV